MHSKALSSLALLGCLLWPLGAQAELPLVRTSQALKMLPDGGARFLSHWGSGSLSTVVRIDGQTEARALGLIPITSRWAVAARGPSTWGELLPLAGGFSAHFAARRFPLMDRAASTIALTTAQNESGLRGEGTIIGVVDTGVDVSHPSLRSPDGTTRVQWLLAFGQEPRGVHPELEEEYGCDGDDPCAVYSRADLNDILDSQVLASLPKDPIGHGTHIASLAAGSNETYPGIAPLADLIVVAAADQEGGVSDARILLGAKFVFDRAAESEKPAVVNISLGSSFGAHDGTSSVEQGLADLTRGSGRAIVIAAGNSGGVLGGNGSYPDPLGVHTQVAVLEKSRVVVPIITPPGSSSKVTGSLFVWISTNRADALRVGFENGDGKSTDLISRGGVGGIHSSTFRKDDDEYDVIILNGVDDNLEMSNASGSAVVAIAGSWKSGRTFEIVLEGETTADLWVTGQGDLGLFESGTGPLLPRAQVRGTVSVPGSSEALITVGSSQNRSDWIDYTGTAVGYPPEAETRSSFSAAGPNRNGIMKPDLLAPGGGVIGAMASEADPRTSLQPVSQFAAHGACPSGNECFVIDDEHALASGTSMSAPLVAGTVALLMQREPMLTLEEAKHYLMAGAHAVPERRLGSLEGTGELDVVGALTAQDRKQSGTFPQASPKESQVVWAEQYLRPGRPYLEGYLLVRDRAGLPTGSKPEELTFEVEGPALISWNEEAVGLVRLSVSASEGSAGQKVTITARLNSEVVDQSTFVIERDPTLAEHGFELVGGTCSVTPMKRSSAPGSALLMLAFFSLFWRSLRRPAPH